MLAYFLLNCAFTLTETETDAMAIVLEDIAVLVQYEHHTIVQKQFLSVSVLVSVSVNNHHSRLGKGLQRT